MFINMFLWFSGAFLQILGVLQYVIEHKMQRCMVGEGGRFCRNDQQFRYAFLGVWAKKKEQRFAPTFVNLNLIL